MSDWEDLPGTERARIVEICETALGSNPGVNLIDVVHECIDWHALWAKSARPEEESSPTG